MTKTVVKWYEEPDQIWQVAFFSRAISFERSFSHTAVFISTNCGWNIFWFVQLKNNTHTLFPDF